MDIRTLSLSGVMLVRAQRFSDQRGYFAETYSRRDFVNAGIDNEFVQDNHSASVVVGTVRGLHFQIPPYNQAKLVRVLRGRIMDVVVDLRRSSPSYGQHLAIELSDENGQQLFVPSGFAHGFCTLVADTEVLYKVDAAYSPVHDRGLYWADPVLGIDWPVAQPSAILSEKDKNLAVFADLPCYFD
jgi:dTDP-4-dehydrorhamnose 3,5-epimerase